VRAGNRGCPRGDGCCGGNDYLLGGSRQGQWACDGFCGHLERRVERLDKYVRVEKMGCRLDS